MENSSPSDWRHPTSEQVEPARIAVHSLCPAGTRSCPNEPDPVTERRSVPPRADSKKRPRQ